MQNTAEYATLQRYPRSTQPGQHAGYPGPRREINEGLKAVIPRAPNIGGDLSVPTWVKQYSARPSDRRLHCRAARNVLSNSDGSPTYHRVVFVLIQHQAPSLARQPARQMQAASSHHPTLTSRIAPVRARSKHCQPQRQGLQGTVAPSGIPTGVPFGASRHLLPPETPRYVTGVASSLSSSAPSGLALGDVKRLVVNSG
ncbi:uncharacterized protein THITE_2120729 [Thermothielavioides terrestris NRRL 8126]|jgi:hypothetical protein|uniref:Uncharacterized protein n=1 Tax=Thermothielavioides terrestris (strain ATCC 38088 / NRRL 8126) TaxID=578455 RepID=G2RDH7_THETT|nr:uncharacterized protein THITE_2120729 [Thermothielavioides terrestris NRRL 8126]AEO69959.1 hypothetical protein THITE_2120729 [Thermothielavioides terrestris NRRL 8126]